MCRPYGMLVSCCVLISSVAVAAEEAKVETLLDGLQNPCGVAVQPGTGHVFVSDSAALKIIRFDPKSGKTEDCITGFPQDVYGKGPKYDIGPLGLSFTADGKYMVVGGGGRPDGEELVYLFSVPEVGKTITADDAAHKVGPIAKGEQSESGEGNFYAVAATKEAIYVTCNGDDKKGWVARSKISGKDGAIGTLTPFIATKEEIEVDAPVGICISPRGELVVGQMGEISEAGNAQLSFYNAKSGRLLLNLATGLNDICAVAYNPESPHLLYALDFSWIDSSKGGLFRLDAGLEDGKPTVNSVPLVALDKPAAMAFAADGTLYVTIFGTPGEDGKPQGKLLKITGKQLNE